MKKILKLIGVSITFIFIFGINNLGYATERLVDIPVPPDSSGYADVTSEEAEQKEKEYKENQENTNITAEEYVGKSSNNYLKKLEIEGYNLNPEFNSQEDNYVIYVKNRSKVNVIAEAEDSKAKIEGDGIVDISKENIININVIAENGNLKVYTIKIENKNDQNKQEDNEEQTNKTNQINENSETKNNNIIIIASVIIIVVIIWGIFVLFYKKSKKVE